MGRDPYWGLALEDDYISRIHAMIFRYDGHWHLMDLASMNYTYHNRERLLPLHPVILTIGDDIQFSLVRFYVVEAGPVKVDDSCRAYPPLRQEDIERDIIERDIQRHLRQKMEGNRWGYP